MEHVMAFDVKKQLNDEHALERIYQDGNTVYFAAHSCWRSSAGKPKTKLGKVLLMKFSLYTDHGHLFAEIRHRWIDVNFLEAKVMAEPAHDSMFIYVFGWSENGLQLNSYKISSDLSKLFAIGWNDSGSH
jgi:hypothetical protein